MKGNYVVAAAVLALVGGGALYLFSLREAKIEGEARAELHALRAPVLAQMKDPDSVLFRNEIRGKKGALCGEFKAKNAMGGYVGYRRFVVVPGVEVVSDSFGTIVLGRGDKAEAAAKSEATILKYYRLTEGEKGVQERYRLNLEWAWATNCS